MAILLHTSVSDEQLCQLVARRDQSPADQTKARQAFGDLYERHARSLVAFLSTRVTSSNVDDVHQSVWERAWQHLPGSFSGGNFRAWLFQITRNYLIDCSRKHRPGELGEDVELVSQSPGPQELAIEHERMRLLARCLERLEEVASAVVRARLGGDDYTEICGRLRLESHQAHSLFHKAKQQLQHCMQQTE